MHYKGVIIMRYCGFGADFIVNVTNTGIGHIFSGRKIPLMLEYCPKPSRILGAELSAFMHAQDTVHPPFGG